MDPDPWNWSVANVQHFFRNTAAEYISDLPHGRLPPLDPFLKTLNENDVSGAVLLTIIDSSALRDDCGITSLGVRSAVIYCIVQLRRESAKYSIEYDGQRLQTPSSLPVRALPSAPAQQEAAVPSTENVRSGEIQVQDASGRKRRKLNLADPEPLQGVAEQSAGVGSSSAVGQGYLGDSACPIDELFYGQAGFGHEVGDLQSTGDVLVYDADREAGLEGQNFQFSYQGKPVGEMRYVYAQLRHFLTNVESIGLRRQDREAIALLPYREGIHQEARSATAVQFRGEKQDAVVVRENAAYLRSGHIPDGQMQQPAGEWEFLVQKHKSKEDELLPVYGESDFDEAEGLTQTSDIDGEEGAEEQADSRFVDQDRVVELIEDAIQQYTTDWIDSLPELEAKKAWTVWKKTKQSRTLREALIQSAQAKMEHLTTRLNKMKAEMLQHTWQSEQSILKACGTLEVTVEDREEQRWMVTVWKRRQEPAHASRPGAKGVRPALPTPVTGEKGERERGFVVHPNDRFSVSPVPVVAPEAEVETEEEIRYEADNEEYHTPIHSPLLPPANETPMLGNSDEMLLGPSDGVEDDDVRDETDAELPEDEAAMLRDIDQASGDEDGSYSPKGNESDSEDLPSPSTFVKPRKPASEPSEQPMSSSIAPIDLTNLSSDASTPKKRARGRPTAKPIKRVNTKPAEMKGNAMTASAAEVDSWDFSELAKSNDRLRLIIKRLREVGEKFREGLDSCLKDLGRSAFNEQLQAACYAHRNGNSDGTGLKPGHISTMLKAALITFIWAFPMYTVQQTKALDRTSFKSAFSTHQLALFTNMLASVLQRRSTRLFVDSQPSSSKPSSSKPSSSSAAILISSSDETMRQDLTPHKKRKREVVKSKTAENSRRSAFQREQKFIESQTTNSAQLAGMASSDPTLSGVEINPAKEDGADFVYISDRIAKKMKPHQIDGAQFIWRELTADDKDGAQGCVLAHTMGLGKTMQTIAFLVAVNEAAQSKKSTVFRQVPLHFRPKGIHERQLRTLILCPPSLIQNWRREIEHWAPAELRNIFNLESTTKASHMDLLEQWMRFGGVALMGYDMFRAAAANKGPKSNQKNIRSEEDRAKLKKMLLEGPEIVVADEAHNLRNRKSAITIAANDIQTHSRIGLTGTPMSNDVQEIYALVSWAAPDYLGDPTEFKAHFAEPIQDGLWHDSTAQERRKSTMKLKVLHAEINPKVDRANIEVLRGSLKPKVEFVITVPLVETQIELYKRYVKTLLSEEKREKADQVTIFGWLAVLTLLTNHPDCFRKKLLAPPTRRKSQQVNLDGDGEADTSGTGTPSPNDSGSATPTNNGTITTTELLLDAEAAKDEPGDEHVYALGFTHDMVQEILSGFTDDTNPKLSAKVTIFLDLLDYSLKCGDKVLVFSSSIPTLEYLDNLLSQEGKLFGRIDGQKVMKKRTQALEEFHRDEFDIMLVSTKAGGVGLNIQGANRVFIFDFGFNPAYEEQAIGRAYRLGQTKPVYVYRFITGGTFETNIYNKQLFKSSLSQRVVDKKNPRRNAERNTREYLYEPKPVQQLDLNEWAGKDPHVLDKLLATHGSEDEGKVDTMIRSISTMETLQEEAVDAPLDEEAEREVSQAIEQSRMRPKGKRASNVELPLPTRPYANGVGTQVQTAPYAGMSTSNSRPPPSTFAGTSAANGPQPHPLGGLPLPRTQQTYQR